MDIGWIFDRCETITLSAAACSCSNYSFAFSLLLALLLVRRKWNDARIMFTYSRKINAVSVTSTVPIQVFIFTWRKLRKKNLTDFSDSWSSWVDGLLRIPAITLMELMQWVNLFEESWHWRRKKRKDWDRPANFELYACQTITMKNHRTNRNR